jgi:hypothetical protein
MNLTTKASLPLYENPHLVLGLVALGDWLTDRHYSSHAAGHIVHFASVHGTLAGAPLLEAEDEAGAEAAFVDALPAACQCNPAWGDDEDPNDGDLQHTEWDDLIPMFDPAAPDVADDGELPSERVDENLGRDAIDILDALGLAPISGGAPSSADLAELNAWLEQADADYPPDAQVEETGIFTPAAMEALYGVDANRYA